mgnify:CR=1 FL=1
MTNNSATTNNGTTTNTGANPKRHTLSLHYYFVGLWCFYLAICASGLPYLAGPKILDSIYNFLLIGSYSFMYLLPVIIVNRLMLRWPLLQLGAVLILSAFIATFLFADSRLFDLYGFHFNGFVWNLLTTEGGLASLGADQVNPYTILRYIAILAASIGMCFLFNRWFARQRIRALWILWIFLAGTLTERVIYGIAYAELYGPIMSQADHMFLYQPLRMNSFLNSIGIDIIKQDATVISGDSIDGNIRYPLENIRLTKTADQPYNIIFLVAESLRYQNIFNDRIMPNTIDFAEKHAVSFNQHYSGGNGTRQALFSMFYGLYGNYWDSFLRDRKTPVLFDVLDQYNYQYFLFTSSYFTYPEFDQTIFGSVPPSSMVETNVGEPWTRDERNVEKLLGKISLRDKDKPFLGFIFFEATHARYSFPLTSEIEKDYIKGLDYAGMTTDELLPMMDGMRARYLNSAHYVDTQFKRVYDFLIANELLDNTIVIITGDHGEEFMEKERWGHNSSFVDEQIRVPLVVSHPDYAPAKVSTMTSHMDIPGMLLTTLGVDNPVSDYSLGNRLFDTTPNDMVVVASWTDLGIISDKGKLVIPFRSTTQHLHLATTRDDDPTDLSELTQTLSAEVARVIGNTRKFRN